MLALGKAKWFVVSEGLFSVLHLGLIVIGVLYVGTEGAAMAFFVLYVIYTIAVYGISRQLIGFRWTPRTQRLLLLLLPVVVLTFVASRLMSVWSATILTGVVTSVVAILCLRGLVQRVGLDNAVVRIACRIPGAHWMLGIK
jgi:PST family polysaccharide transporter